MPDAEVGLKSVTMFQKSHFYMCKNYGGGVIWPRNIPRLILLTGPKFRLMTSPGCRVIKKTSSGYFKPHPVVHWKS